MTAKKYVIAQFKAKSGKEAVFSIALHAKLTMNVLRALIIPLFLTKYANTEAWQHMEEGHK